MRFWTKERLDQAVDEFRKEPDCSTETKRRIAARLSKRWKREITAGAMERAMFHAGLAPLDQYIIGAPDEYSEEEEEDPVVAHVERKREKREKRDNRDLIERCAAAEERVRVLQEISVALPPVKIRERERVSGLREATAVALASDWHVEEVVESRKVSGANAYNLQIAEARIHRFFDGLRWLLSYHRQGFTIRELVLWLGGDLITGHIHEDLAESNELSPTQAILWLMPRLIAGIRGLLEDPLLERIVIPCSFGNHGRTTPKRRIQTAAENSFEWFMYHVLASHFADESRVRFQIADGAHSHIDVYSFRLHFHHGDDVNYGGGVGGLSIPLNKAVVGWNTVKTADYHCIGHFHQLLWGRDWCSNGSMIGYSTFAYSVKAHFEKPQQSFFLMDAKHGRCQMTPLWVDQEMREAA